MSGVKSLYIVLTSLGVRSLTMVVKSPPASLAPCTTASVTFAILPSPEKSPPT